MAFLCYKGLKDGGTFYLDGATATKIQKDTNAIIGKAVTFVDGSGEPMVGYGVSNGSPIAGIVEKIEPTEENVAPTAAKAWVVTVVWNETFEKIPTQPSAKTAVAGKPIAVDDNGNVIVVEPAVASNAFCMSVAGSEAKTCTIRVL